MSRLPPTLQPAWPLFKRAHRLLALVLGVVFRQVSFCTPSRGVPRRTAERSMQTCALDSTVTYHGGGPGESRRVLVPDGSPPEHWVFVAGTDLRVPARYTLELIDGVVVGDYGAVITAGGILDFETSGYFGLASWREHPIFLRPLLPRRVHVPGTLLNLSTRGATSNYYHFVFDALPRLGIMQECLQRPHFDAVLVPHRRSYQREFLELIGLEVPLIQPEPHRAVQADRLLVPSTPNEHLAAPEWVARWLREHFPPTSGGEGKRLYLTRGNRPRTRRYLQEAQLLPALEKRGFIQVDPGTLSVQEQINLFHGAEVIVAPHGAALTNLVFSRPEVKVLEMFANDYVHLGLWNITHSLEKADYRYVVADGSHRTGAPMTGVLQDIDIPPGRILAALDELLS